MLLRFTSAQAGGCRPSVRPSGLHSPLAGQIQFGTVNILLASVGRSLLIQKRTQFARTARMFELAQSFRLDLTNAFTGDVKLLADLFQRMVGVHTDAETHPQNAFLARRQRRQNPRAGFFQVGMDRGIKRLQSALVGDKIAEGGIFFVTDGRFQADRLFGNLHHLAHLLKRHRKPRRQFFRHRFPSHFRKHLS